jgi:hypothetical protein
MSGDDLKNLLEETSAGVPAPSFAHASWARAQKIKSRQQRYGVSAAAVAVLAVVAVILVPRSAPPPAVTPPSPSSTALSPQVQTVPSTLPERLIAPLPTAAADLRPRDAIPLSEHPVDAAVAVVQHTPEEPGASPEPVHALAPDGTWVRIDVADLTFTRDAGGNRAAPLRPLSLSPDRRRIAVPQPEAVVVIDLTSAKAHRVPVPGLNEQVAWQDDTTVLVGADGPGASAVDWAAGTVTRLPAALSLWDSVATGGSLLEIPAERRELREWRPDRAGPVRVGPIDDAGPPGYAVESWYGSPITDGEHLVRGSWGNTPARGYESVSVLDARTGTVVRVLDLGAGRWKGCCKPLAFVDATTVLIQTERDALIAWNFATGEVWTVSRGTFAGLLSVRLR